MNFKQIEVVGFKSFADPIKLTFSEGITTIVGPNGCGKSNVADAIRWVLGEQSSKMLRGTSMQDVIFKGTEKRKSMSYCEVSLCFDNSNKIFNSQFEEIVITRKLYRSGESEYMINRAPGRLKDIIDLLHDSGIGKSGYSIIGQGKVDEIINSKPEDRRAIFEEAAGISKFKFKKVEAERKLDRTRDNLLRLNDIITEIDRQLSPLKKQSETAKIYLEYKEKLKSLEINAYIHQYDSASENKDIINTRINAILEEMTIRQRELDQAGEDYNKYFDELNGLDQKVNNLRDKELNLTVSLEKHTGQTNLINEKINNYQLEYNRLVEQKDKLTTLIENSQQQLYTNKISIDNKKNESASLNHSLTELNDVYQNISSQLEVGENEVELAQKKIFDELSKLGDQKAQLSALKAEQCTYGENLQLYTAELQDYTDKHRASKQNEVEALDKLNSLANKRDTLSHQIELLSNGLDNKNSEYKNTQNRLYQLNNTLIAVENKKKMLEDMQKEYEGFNGSVKRLLSDSEKIAELKSKIVGVLASLIKVPDSYQTAIEMALGNAVQNIVTQNDSHAKDLIEYLKQKQYGRVTFLPINSIKPRYFDQRYNSSLTAVGSFGLASKLISYDSKIENVISSLLGSTVIVNNMENAIKIAKSTNYGFRIVTLDGDILSPQGSISGGSKRSVTNLLSRENDIKNASNKIVELNAQKGELEKLEKDLSTEINQVKVDLDAMTNDYHNTQIEYAQVKTAYESINKIVVDYKNNINKAMGNIDKTNQILATISENIKSISNAEDKQFEATAINNQFGALRIQRDEYAEKITDIKIKLNTFESEVSNLEQDTQRIQFELTQNKDELEKVNYSINNIQALFDEFKQTVESSSSNEVVEIQNQLKTIKEQLSKLNEVKLELQSNLRLLEESRMNLSTQVSQLQDKKYKEDINLNKIDIDIETMQERVWTEYEMTYTTALDYRVDEFDIKQGMQEISKLKKEISKLGNINVNAIEDYKLLLERHGSLYEQAQDLIKAEDDLKIIIKELSNEMILRFESEFNKINENFGHVFQELFGGGRARLELVNSGDILECGVDIIAEPPGKKLSNITLLSGGEKALTAISILFAIIRLRPMPFCLLDEIEAALDEANVGRFAKYLKRYSSETQFIVITHKKPTMEHADVLYGVTMEEKGVSKIVSVKLSEAKQYIEKN